ncbi:hypothetical protein EVAR_44466_1 [Eumeta japonica]|uniref:Kinetochore protein Spc24 n=1 Tax=Eumeta variegata TaxID=151549 RepID=A0A4C1WJR2_EUMVA|nr:hypothetical protein EVAR_44466_1 [Eumeta japonica]
MVRLMIMMMQIAVVVQDPDSGRLLPLIATLTEQKQQLEACKKKDKLESRLASELQHYEQLRKRAAEASARRAELRRVCARLEQPSLTAGDSSRLSLARETYEVGKRLTGVRWDFTAGEDRVKGYVQNESRRLLRPFDVAPPAQDAIWDVMAELAHPGWAALLPA